MALCRCLPSLILSQPEWPCCLFCHPRNQLHSGIVPEDIFQELSAAWKHGSFSRLARCDCKDSLCQTAAGCMCFCVKSGLEPNS